MEVYLDEATTLDLTVPPGAVNVFAQFYRNDVELPTAVEPTIVGTVAHFNLPYSVVSEVGPVVMKMTFAVDFQVYEKEFILDVFSPYATVADIREELELPDSVTDAQVKRAERRARRKIDAFCKQSFHKTRETLYVRGQGNVSLRMPKRLIGIDTMAQTNQPTLMLTSYQIRHDGLVLQKTIDYAYEEPLTTVSPIYYPFGSNTSVFEDGTEWGITGYWGWENVPEPVRDAAILLIEQELCPESLYRDRYIVTMSAADWRFETSDRAWTGTGNAVADEILSEYVWDGIGFL